MDALILAHNQLTQVPAGVFRHLNQLNSLELEGNQIAYIDKDAFAGLEGTYIDRMNCMYEWIVCDMSFVKCKLGQLCAINSHNGIKVYYIQYNCTVNNVRCFADHVFQILSTAH